MVRPSAGSVTSMSLEQPLKAPSPMKVMESGVVMAARGWHSHIPGTHVHVALPPLSRRIWRKTPLFGRLGIASDREMAMRIARQHQSGLLR